MRPPLARDTIAPPKRENSATPRPTGTNGGTRYGLAALESECSLVTAATNGGRHAALNIAALKLGHVIGGGELERETAEAALTGAATALIAEGRSHEVQRTIRDGIEAGMVDPHRAPERDLSIGGHVTAAPPADLPEGVVVRLADVAVSAPEYDAEPVIRRRGLHLVVAAPGTLKTMLMLLFAMEQTQRAPGASLLGLDAWTIRRRWRSVLWIGDEESAGELRYRAEVLARGYGLRPPQGEELLFADASGGETMLDLRHVPQLVGRYPNVDAVVVDPLANLTPGTDEQGRPVKVDLDNPHALRTVCRPLRRLCKQRDVAVFLLHHLNASGERERGPTAYRGSCDVLLRLDGSGELLKVACEKNRDGERPTVHLQPVWTGHRTSTASPLTLRLEPTTAPTPPSEADLPPTAVKILAAIRVAGPLSKVDASDAAPGVHRTTRTRAIALLLTRKLVSEQPDGRLIACAEDVHG